MDTRSVILGAVITLLLVGVIGGVVYGVSQSGQMDDSPVNQSAEPVNESQIPEQAVDSKQGAAALKESFNNEYEYEARVFIQRDGQVILSYNSTAQNGNQLKSEMKDVALLYSDVAANNTEIGALTIQANGVLLTIPADTAIAHGNGDINEEAYFKNMRFDQVSEE